MPWVFDTDSFIIKSEGIFDFDAFIASIMQNDDTSMAGYQNAVYGLNHNFDDFEGQQMNPYEADAIEMAIRSGKIDDNMGRIIHSGPETPGYAEAVQQALVVGRPLVNAAAERQIAINEEKGTGFEKPQLPFGPDGRLNAQYVMGNGATSTVNQQKAGMGIDGRMKQRKGEGSFNPMLNGKLVHSVLSGRDNRQEGWARWYEDGAKQLNLVETRYKQDGQPRGDRRYVIPAHYVHKDVISINDKQLLTTIGNHIKGLQGQGMAPEQIKADLTQQPFMFNALHHSNHNYDSIHGRVDRKHQENQEIRDGLMMPTEDDDLDAGYVAPGAQKPDASIIPPEAMGEAWASRAGQSGYHPSKSKAAVKGMMKHFGMEEEEASALLHRVYDKVGGGFQGNAQQRLYQALYQYEMDKHGGNLPDDHHYTGPRPPLDGRGIEPGQPAAPPVVAQPPAQPEQPPQPNIPAEAPVNPPAPPLPLGPQVVARPPPMGNLAPKPQTINDNRFIPETSPTYQAMLERRAGINNQNPNIPLSESKPVGPAVGDKLSRFAELLGRASSSDIFRRSDEFKSEIEDYIEGVQVELAKTVIDDYHDIQKMDINSPLDIAIVSSRIQRPTTDVISIFHTRGDWRNIAKSFHISHEDVQLVKVALNG